MDLSNLSSHLPPTSPITDESIEQVSKEITANFKEAAKSVAALYKLSHSKNSLLMSKGYLNCLDDLLQVISTGGDVENWVLLKRNELVNMNKASNTSNKKSSVVAEAEASSTTVMETEEEEEEIEEETDELEEEQEQEDEVRRDNSLNSNDMRNASFKMDKVSESPFKFPLSMIPLSFNSDNLKQSHHHHHHHGHGHSHGHGHNSSNMKKKKLGKKTKYSDNSSNNDNNNDNDNDNEKAMMLMTMMMNEESNKRKIVTTTTNSYEEKKPKID